MIDWDALRADMPQIVEQLLDAMTEEAIPHLIRGLQAWPAVEIGYTTKAGETFKVRLSVEQDTSETEQQS